MDVRAALQTTAAGRIELEAEPYHRIRVHAGPPVAGLCGRDPFLYTRGDIDVLPAGDAATWVEHDSSTALVVSLAPSFVQRAADDLRLRSRRVSIDTWHQAKDPQIEHIAWALDAERAAEHPSGPLYTESLGLALAARLIRREAPAPVFRYDLSRSAVRRVMRYIDEHLDRPLSLLELAQIGRVSASQLKSLFKRSTGLAVHQFVIRRRVERARALIEEGGRPVSQIALDVGFAHQSHLARWMRRLHGTSPSALSRRTRTGLR